MEAYFTGIIVTMVLELGENMKKNSFLLNKTGIKSLSIIYLFASLFVYKVVIEKNLIGGGFGIVVMTLIFYAGLSGISTSELKVYGFPLGKKSSRIYGYLMVLFSLGFLLIFALKYFRMI